MTAPAPTPPLRRRRTGRFVAGVAGGVADHLGAPLLWVRAAFVLLTLVSGAGVVAYGLLWVFVKQEKAEVRRAVGSAERQQAFGLAALGVGAGIAVSALTGSALGWIVGPLGVAAVGAAVVWREVDDAQRRRWTAGARIAAGGRAPWLRVATGAVFVAAGIAVFLVGNLQLGQVQFALLAVVAALVGVGVITVPWWVKLVRDLGEERRERIVEAERAEIAAHLHDSVLQTLALIQRQSDEPREVLRLARGQERELRHWLYGPTGYGRPVSREGALGGGLAAEITAVAAEVEDTYAIDVRPVVVGDHPLDDDLRALVLATREALVNAAKHAGVGEVSVYAEVEAAPDGGEVVTVFVRDRGAGFAPDAVPHDRHGLAESVHGRMKRHGGTVRLRSARGEGTEVQLRMSIRADAGAGAGAAAGPAAASRPVESGESTVSARRVDRSRTRSTP